MRHSRPGENPTPRNSRSSPLSREISTVFGLDQSLPMNGSQMMKRPPLPQPSPPEEERETLKEFLGLMPLFFESSILLTSAPTILELALRQRYSIGVAGLQSPVA